MLVLPDHLLDSGRSEQRVLCRVDVLIALVVNGVVTVRKVFATAHYLGVLRVVFLLLNGSHLDVVIGQEGQAQIFAFYLFVHVELVGPDIYDRDGLDFL